jgi:O-antigen ligase
MADTRNPFLLFIWLFFSILTFVGLININVVSYNFFDFTIFQNIFLFWFLINHERKDPLVLEKGMISFALGSVAIALLFYSGIGIEYEEGRVKIFGDNQNIIGLRMSISLAILILTIAQNRLKLGRLRYLLVLPIPIMLQLMVETGSRVAFISFALVLAVWVFLFKTKKVIGKTLVFSMGAIISIILWIYLIQSDTLLQRLLISSETGDLAGRDIIWQKLLPLIESNPIFGVGRTGYDYFTQITFGGMASPHNVIIEVLCYTGIIGLIIYLLFLFHVFKKGYKNYRTNGLLLPLLLLIPVLGILVSAQILEVKIGWAIFAYVAGSSVFKAKSETTGDTTPLVMHENSLRHL